MALHVHEIHSAVVHGPLVLLPTAAAVDLAAALQRDRTKARLGNVLWWSAVGSGLFAGLTGLAASQEVKAEKKAAQDMMWLHGAINAGVVMGAIGMAVFRARSRPSVTSALLGFGASATAFFTAYLGGEMVYTHGLGVKAMPEDASTGVSWSPRVLSRGALPTLLRDAGRGLVWLLGRAGRTLRGREGLSRDAVGQREPGPTRGAIDDATAV